MIGIEKSGAFDYGNGKCMWMDFSEPERYMSYDIRYDTRYNSSNEPEYIKTFIKDKWSGQNGSWKAQYITIKKIFELEGDESNDQ